MSESEIRIRVDDLDILRALEDEDDTDRLGREHTCAVAQALIRAGFIGVEVRENNRVYIGMDIYEAVDERPIGEQLSQFTQTFDDWMVERTDRPEPAEFVLRKVR